MGRYFKISFRNTLSILSHADLFFPRLMVSLSSLITGILLLMSGIITNHNTEHYEIMEHIMSIEYWAILFLIQGVFGLFGLLLYRMDKILILADSILGAILWGSLVSMQLVTFYSLRIVPPFDMSSQILMAFMSWWALARTNYGK